MLKNRNSSRFHTDGDTRSPWQPAVPAFTPSPSQAESLSRSWLDALTETIGQRFYSALTARYHRQHCRGDVVTETSDQPDTGALAAAVTYRCLACGERWAD